MKVINTDVFERVDSTFDSACWTGNNLKEKKVKIITNYFHNCVTVLHKEAWVLGTLLKCNSGNILKDYFLFLIPFDGGLPVFRGCCFGNSKVSPKIVCYAHHTYKGKFHQSGSLIRTEALDDHLSR